MNGEILSPFFRGSLLEKISGAGLDRMHKFLDDLNAAKNFEDINKAILILKSGQGSSQAISPIEQLLEDKKRAVAQTLKPKNRGQVRIF